MNSNLVLLVLCTGLLSLCVHGGEAAAELKVGDPAPDVTTTDEAGKEVKLSSFKDKQGVVIFFFPKAFTGGCTAETCGFRDDAAEYTARGYALVGASRDPSDVLTKFKEENKAPYGFISDPKGDLAKSLGLTPGARQTIVIGKDGKVEHIYKSVQPLTHPKDVLKDLPEKK